MLPVRMKPRRSSIPQVARRHCAPFVEPGDAAVDLAVRVSLHPRTTRSSSRSPPGGFLKGDTPMIKTALFAAAAALATIATAAPALADQVTVRYNDLDLATPAGQSKLARRLDMAARDACGLEATRTGTRIPSSAAAQCYKEAQVRSKNTMATILGQAQQGG
jgi:UrcA family protein